MKHFGEKTPSYAEFLSMPPYSAQRLFQKVLPGKEQAVPLFYQFLPRQRATPMQGAHDLLCYLCKKSIPMAVISNKRGDALRQEVKAMQWDSYFFTVVGAGDAERDKPFADPLVYALDRHADLVCGADIWFVGDSCVDKECAHNAGCTSVLIHNTSVHNAFPTFQSCQGFLHYISRILEKKDMC